MQKRASKQINSPQSKINVNTDFNNTPENQNYAVEMIDICKSFLNGKIIANDHLSLRVRKNEVHAIIGENGAGKSTLMSILFGIYTPDSGTIKINDKNVYFSSAKDASDSGLGMVHQHFKLVHSYSVFENIILGSELVGKLGILKTRESKKKIETLIKQYQFNLNVNTKVSNLTVGQEQKTEILKLLYRDSNILIFDEPTAVLSPDEIEHFLEMVLKLKQEGKTIIIITHKFAEIKSVADRATIIRHGRYISDFNVADKTSEEMAEEMVGKKVSIIKNNSLPNFGDVLLNVKNLKIDRNMLPSNLYFYMKNPEVWKLRKLITEDIKMLHNIKHEIAKDQSQTKHDSLSQEIENLKLSFRKKQQIKIETWKRRVENNPNKEKTKANFSKQKSILFNFNREFSSKEKNKTIDFKVKKGEVFAIAGVEGNGQSELALILSGIIKNKNAIIQINERDIAHLNVHERYDFGISHVPEDRHKYGLVLDMPIYINSALNRIDEKPFSKFGFLNDFAIKEHARTLIQKYDVRGTTRGTAPARLLSGGNQQKLIVGREMTNNHKIIIMVQPTRGLDLGAIEYVHKKILEEKQKGNAVLLISYELDEILSLADTIAVMYNGVFIGVGNKQEMTRKHIGELMAGSV